jgi:hypothetical protein
MPRFVILEHDHPHLHWDLMLETGNVLRTWRLENPPSAYESTKALAIGDHRKAYLDFEGPLSNNRGTVKRWDFGTFAGDPLDDMHVTIEIKGSRLEGMMQIKRQSGDTWEAFLNPTKGQTVGGGDP